MPGVRLSALLLTVSLLVASSPAQPPVASWSLERDSRDSSGNGLHLAGRGVRFGEAGAKRNDRPTATFDGRTSVLEAANDRRLDPGTGAFSISAWVHTAKSLDDVLGDVVSKFDPARRTGFQLSIKNNVGVTNTSANYRHVHFGIDNGRVETSWTDHGRPGNNMYVFSLLVHRGRLYAGTCEPGIKEAGHVYEFDGKSGWKDLGTPDRSNAVSTLCSFGGEIYAGTTKYRLAGSSLPESPNLTKGGRVYKYMGGKTWKHLGKLGEAESLYGSVVYKNRLYFSALYSPGLFRYDGGTKWTNCGTFEGKRVESLAVYNGAIYATGFDEAGVYRYDGDGWEHLGIVGKNTQTYGFAVYRGDLHVSSWPTGSVFRMDESGEKTKWEFVGRLGMEKESMPLAVYNGMMYSGTLPLGEVFRFDGGKKWTSLGRIDTTPNVRYRRAWSMAVYRGRLFAGVLPSGRVKSIEAGKSVTSDVELPSGWVHLAAVRGTDRLKLYIDGKKVAESTRFKASQFDLANRVPLAVGRGQHDHFNGSMSDVRFYRRALSDADVKQISRK
ncbi:MAG: LamG domain-containing protein [Planctomycetales bacterium]|nr:LamG domain-containing protein [Planctomycetales bacterium]